jgi:hypothetical protein
VAPLRAVHGGGVHHVSKPRRDTVFVDQVLIRFGRTRKGESPHRPFFPVAFDHLRSGEVPLFNAKLAGLRYAGTHNLAETEDLFEMKQRQ